MSFYLRIEICHLRELFHGIPVFDEHGNRLGDSKVRDDRSCP